MGVTLQLFEVKQAQDLLNAFSEITRQRPDALLIVMDSIIAPYRQLIAEFTANNSVMALRDYSVIALRDYAEGGGP